MVVRSRAHTQKQDIRGFHLSGSKSAQEAWAFDRAGCGGLEGVSTPPDHDAGENEREPVLFGERIPPGANPLVADG